MATDPTPPQPTRALSGIQPTGRFHWGNYFGAIRQYIELQPGGHDQAAADGPHDAGNAADQLTGAKSGRLHAHSPPFDGPPA